MMQLGHLRGSTTELRHEREVIVLFVCLRWVIDNAAGPLTEVDYRIKA
jgi:hypothetical protein